MSRNETPLGLLIVALFSFLGPLGMIVHSRVESGRNLEAEEQASDALQRLRAGQAAWFRINQSYSTRIDELGLFVPRAGWHYSMLIARIDGRPGVTIEADNGQERLVIDPTGQLLRSPGIALPMRGVWRAPKEGGGKGAASVISGATALNTPK